MKKMNKMLITGIAVASIGVIGANASTYIGNKKYDFKEFENKDISTLFRYNDKINAYIPKKNLLELSMGDKITLNETTVSPTELYKDKSMNIYTFYFGCEAEEDCVWPKKISATSLNISDAFKAIENTEEENIDINPKMDLYDLGEEVVGEPGGFGVAEYNNQIYFTTYEELEDENYNEYLYIYSTPTDGKMNLIKKFDMNELASSVIKEDNDYSYMDLNYSNVSDKEDAYVKLSFTEVNNETGESIDKVYVYNLNKELYLQVSDKNIFSNTMIYSNGEDKLLYTSCDDLKEECSVKVTDKNGNTSVLQKGDSNIYAYIQYGIIGVIDQPTVKLYDNNLNLIKEYTDVYELNIDKEITTFEEIDRVLYKELENGNYLITLLDENYDNIKQELMTVNDAESTKISGILKDKDGNPLKDYEVTFAGVTKTTDKNGYFNFDVIKLGEYTLTVKNTEGNIVATKKIILTPGEENKMDGDTIYFKNGDGFNINLKLDGENVSVESLSNYIKHNEDVPQTFDKLALFIISLLVLVVSGVLVNKKMNKIKYLKN